MKQPTPIEDVATIVAYAELALSYAKHGDTDEAEVLFLAMRKSLETRYDPHLLNEKVVKILQDIKNRVSISTSLFYGGSNRQN